VPRAATADRGYGEAVVDDRLHPLGVERVAIPRSGAPSGARRAHKHTPMSQADAGPAGQQAGYRAAGSRSEPARTRTNQAHLSGVTLTAASSWAGN
jgi:hypothetical protein